LERVVSEFELIFVDDGSTDRTGELVRARASREPRLKVITNPKNLNVAASAKKAFRAASKQYLFWQTVDWSYDISHLRIFLELLKHFDVVTGVRPTPERVLSHIPVVRSVYRVRGRSDNLKSATVSLGNYYVVRLLYGLPFHDVQNVAFYPTALVNSFDLTGDSSFLGPEMMCKALASGATYLEVPIPFIPRTAGASKGSTPSAIYRSVRDIMANWFDWGFETRKQIAGLPPGVVSRVSEPAFLSEQVLELAVPLFKYFR